MPRRGTSAGRIIIAKKTLERPLQALEKKKPFTHGKQNGEPARELHMSRLPKNETSRKRAGRYPRKRESRSSSGGAVGESLSNKNGGKKEKSREKRNCRPKSPSGLLQLRRKKRFSTSRKGKDSRTHTPPNIKKRRPTQTLVPLSPTAERQTKVLNQPHLHTNRDPRRTWKSGQKIRGGRQESD